MGIRFKSTFDAIKAAKKIRDKKLKKLNIAMADAKDQILERVAKGQGVDSALAPYTKKYERWKVRKGRSTKPDLRFTGQMLKAMQTTAIKSGKGLIGRIFFLEQEVIKAIKNQSLRKFFGLSEKQKLQIQQKMKG